MKKNNFYLLFITMAILVVSCDQSQKSGREVPAPRTYKMTTAIPEGIAVPDQVNSRLGTLKFFDGFPDDATTEKLYDNLDFQRATQAYLLGIPAVSMEGMKKGLTTWGPPNVTILTFERLADSRTLILTANSNSPYTLAWLDLHDGPLVLEVPPAGLGFINNSWSQFVVDIGIVGPDKGKGGKYLILPPGFEGTIPGGYFVVHSPTFGCLYGNRLFAVNGDFQPAIEAMKNNTRIYLLAQAGNPPANNFVDVSGKEFNCLAPSDSRFWEYLNEVVQREPFGSFDRVSSGYFASIGVEKGKPFAPDARMKKILADAALVGDATARAITYRIRQKEDFFYENSAWRNIFLGGTTFESTPGVLNHDGYMYLYFMGIGISPAEDLKIIGKGSQYGWVSLDSKGNPMDGGKNYSLHLPTGIPVKDFWSVILYDTQTRSFLQTDQQFPMASSQNKGMVINADGSVDVFFGPEAPAGKENNWIQTIPGKSWFAILRLYGPLEPWFDKTWRPGEIELIQ